MCEAYLFPEVDPVSVHDAPSLLPRRVSTDVLHEREETTRVRRVLRLYGDPEPDVSTQRTGGVGVNVAEFVLHRPVPQTAQGELRRSDQFEVTLPEHRRAPGGTGRPTHSPASPKSIPRFTTGPVAAPRGEKPLQVFADSLLGEPFRGGRGFSVSVRGFHGEYFNVEVEIVVHVVERDVAQRERNVVRQLRRNNVARLYAPITRRHHTHKVRHIAVTFTDDGVCEERQSDVGQGDRTLTRRSYV